MLKVLKGNRDLRLLLVGSFVSMLGSRMQSFALSLYVLNTTGSAVKFASIIALSFIPSLLLGPFAGVIADWFNRKKIIVYLDLLSSALIACVTVYYYVFGDIPMWLIYIAVIGLSIISSVFNPAATVVIPMIVSKEELFEANSARSIVDNSANLLSAIVAGALLGFFNIGIILAFNALSFLISAISETSINIPYTPVSKDRINIRGFVADFGEGFQIIKASADITAIIVLGVLINFIFSPVFSIAIPYVVKTVHHYSDVEFGIMQTVAISGLIIGPIIGSNITRKLALNLTVFYFMSLCGAFTIVIGYASFSKTILGSDYGALIIITLFSLLVAVTMTISNIAIGTMFQKVVPMEAMGRVGALMGTLVSAMTPLGQMLLGITIENVHSGYVIIIGGVLTICLIAVYYQFTRKFSHVTTCEVVSESVV